MPFTVSRIDGGDAWDQEIADLDASPLMSRHWLQALSSPRRRPVHLRLHGTAGVSGAAAGLVLEPSFPPLRPYGRRLFLYTGPALSAPEPWWITEALEAVVEFARRERMAAVVCRSWDYPRSFPFPDVLCHRSRRHEFVLDLAPDVPGIDARMRPQVHRQVRQARAAGLTFRGSEQAGVVDDLLALLKQTRAVRLAKGHDDYDFFYMPHLGRETLARLFHAGLARGYAVDRELETLAVVIVLVLGRRAVALLVGTSAEGYRLKAPSLLWCEAARHLKKSGVLSLNLLGVPSTPDGKSLAFFKQSLGCDKLPCSDAATGLLRRSPLYLAAKLWSGRRVGWT